jgi:hypothetical protein
MEQRHGTCFLCSHSHYFCKLLYFATSSSGELCLSFKPLFSYQLQLEHFAVELERVFSYAQMLASSVEITLYNTVLHWIPKILIYIHVLKFLGVE